ncbi:L-arabinonate dehydratase [Streptomyces millisiae]|uniref:L-arabinonate dehydratase n=1 Tax=Streptomyces millisiae TaxID=3075542 RepID=A0ABU2LNL0_9ACTN|nr:L-arabinonate dehydratase [Streptomyces sp. DSM 44918]MDT0319169.1 L-arabinonate dehydratase [Streptomyces sp. DSM 44918]
MTIASREGSAAPDAVGAAGASPAGPAGEAGAPSERSGRQAETLRSHQWYGTEGLRTFSHRARTRQLGYLPEEHLGKPVIAILNTWSDINPCHQHLRERAQAVKRGVWQAGGFPLEFPVATLSETFQKPTPMLYRNLLAMETEELLRSYPVDGVVLMGGCDKTTPALMMGAASADLPAVFVPAGPMLRGHWRNETLGSGTDMWKYWDEKRAGRIGDREMGELENGLARSPGTCMTMGTASTMTSAVEALGLTIPGAAAIPAVDSGHERMAAAAGLRIVGLVNEGVTLSRYLTRDAYEDAITTVLSLGGSTNAVIHLIAMAGRSQVDIDLDDFDRIARKVPVLADVRPGGRFLMEDFYYAGGLPGLLARLGEAGLLHLDRPTITHATMREQLAGALVHDDEVIRPLDNPAAEQGGLAVLRGNLAPDGAVIKHISAEPHLHRHTGPAVVFDDYRTMQRTINDPELNITKDHVLVLRGSGPLGGPGMPEYGMLPIPDYLLKEGVTDMVRLSDARMSGTSYGACVLHIAPESHVGGPLALVQNGDLITLDVEARVLRLEVDDEELARRRAAWTPPPERYGRGYGALYQEHITQADTGCDFAFLSRPGEVPEPYAG